MTAEAFVEEFSLRLRAATAGKTLAYTHEGFEAYKAIVLRIFEDMGVVWENATWITDPKVSEGQDTPIDHVRAHTHESNLQSQRPSPLGGLDTQKPD